jgi:hypothetical protein
MKNIVVLESAADESGIPNFVCRIEQCTDKFSRVGERISGGIEDVTLIPHDL